MKRIISIIIAALPLALMAQTAERQVISSTGGRATASGLQVSYTAGEVATTTGSSASLILTQGFQQSNTYGVGVHDIKSGLSINAYPNPVKGMVILDLNAPNAMELTISVSDISGRQTPVPTEKVSASGASQYQLNLSSLAAGSYYLQLTNADRSLHQTIKIQKVD